MPPEVVSAASPNQAVVPLGPGALVSPLIPPQLPLLGSAQLPERSWKRWRSRGWAQESVSLSVRIQQAQFSITFEILRGQSRAAKVRRDPAG